MNRLLLAGQGTWLSGLEEAIRHERGLSVASRCEDLAELLAMAAAGMGDTAVISGDLGGLDLDSVSALRRMHVVVVAVAASPDAQEWLARLGVDRAIPPFSDPGSWIEMLPGLSDDDVRDPAGGDCVSVWGHTGGPGATTVAISLGLASAGSGTRTILIDLDPDGASIAQQMGLSDSGSGLERACRAAQAGTLTPATFDSLTAPAAKGLTVLTGVLRPDRWPDLRRSALEAVLEVARAGYDRVVCDVGSDIYDVDDSAAPRPSTATSVGIDAADHLVLVGSADSVGVARLLRGVDRLTGNGRRADVVVNRWRAGVGWSQRELIDLLGEVAPSLSVSVLPMDVASADAAAHCGGSPWLCRASPGKESDSPLGASLHEMTAKVLGIQCRVETSPRSLFTR